MLLTFGANRVHSALVPGRGLIVIQTNPFAAGFIDEGKIMDSFELAVCFDTLFDIGCFSCYYTA